MRLVMKTKSDFSPLLTSQHISQGCETPPGFPPLKWLVNAIFSVWISPGTVISTTPRRVHAAPGWPSGSRRSRRRFRDAGRRRPRTDFHCDGTTTGAKSGIASALSLQDPAHSQRSRALLRISCVSDSRVLLVHLGDTTAWVEAGERLNETCGRG